MALRILCSLLNDLNRHLNLHETTKYNVKPIRMPRIKSKFTVLLYLKNATRPPRRPAAYTALHTSSVLR